MKSFLKFMIPAALLLASCSPNVYKDKSFFSKHNLNGQTLAILPVEVSFMGNLPKSWDAARVEREEQERSLAFQEEIYEDLLFRSSSRSSSKKAAVKLMDIGEVNRKLKEQGIAGKRVHELSTVELADILGADMIIRSKVDNVRYMSQAAAVGINAGASIIEGMINRGGNSAIYAPRARAGESDMYLSLHHASGESAIARVESENKLKVRKLPVYIRN